jgi:hypothetical protein
MVGAVEAIADRDWNKAFSVTAPFVTPRAEPRARPRRRWRHAEVAHVDGQVAVDLRIRRAEEILLTHDSSFVVKRRPGRR